MQKRDENFIAKLLLKYKLPLVESGEAADDEGAARIARKIGYPVAVKVISPDIVHKTDAGGVKLGISNDEELKESISSIRKSAGKNRVTGFLIQKMEKGLEVIVGMKRDAQFGPVIMVGLGGIFVEFMKDVSFRIAPITRADAENMLEELKGSRIIKGARGQSYDVGSLISILLKISDLSLKENDVKEIDLNPVILEKEKAVIVDARIMCD